MVFLLKKFKNELFFFFNKHIKNKMQYLNQDVQIHIFSYFEPEDIIHCYYNRCFTNILKELSSHIGFMVVCKKNVSEKMIYWFEKNNISLHLLRTTRINNKGCYITFVNGLKHSENDLPSFFKENDYSIWHKNGLRHRDHDLPAYISKDGYRAWYQNGLKHRDHDSPAMICSNGIQKWFQHDKLHRDGDLPAIVSRNGTQYWFQHGQLHRDLDSPAIIYRSGCQSWYQHGRMHRDNDLPADIWSNGRQVWYQHGKKHRDNDLPAEIHLNGDQKWYRNGKLHRDNNLPAVITNHRAQYFIDGVFIRTCSFFNVEYDLNSEEDY